MCTEFNDSYEYYLSLHEKYLQCNNFIDYLISIGEDFGTVMSYFYSNGWALDRDHCSKEDSGKQSKKSLNVRREFIEENRSSIICEPSGKSLDQLNNDKMKKINIINNENIFFK